MEKKTGLSRIIHATGYSLQGIRYNFKHEAAFRQECFAAMILIPVASFLPALAMVERLLLLGSIVLVLVVELLNTGIEAVVDRVSTEIHPLSGQAKDAASAAVFLSLVFCIVTWLAILMPKLI